VEVRVADTAEKDFDLYIVFAWIAPRDPKKTDENNHEFLSF
jgi:hypothetical protein